MSADPALAPVQPAPTSITAFVGATGRGPVDTPVRVSSPADYRSTFGGSDPSPLDDAVELFFANGGTDAIVVRAAGTAPEQIVPASGGGLHAITEPFTVLVLPGVTSSHQLAVSRALARCEDERAVLLLDLPETDDGTVAARHADQVPGPRSRVAAYHPWLVAGARTVPPSGAVAGVLARTDASRGVWRAPAGEDAGVLGVDGPGAALTDGEVATLSDHGVNALRGFHGRGLLVWGARVLSARDSAEGGQRYLPVRRLADHVLTSLEEGMAFTSTRRPDPGLGDLVRHRAEVFLHGLWRQGALQGTTASDAYFARCDATTTTQADREAGRMILLVGFAPLRPAEFETHTLELATTTTTAEHIPAAAAALAEATRLAREHLTVVRRADLRTLTAGSPGEAERRLRREFANAAQGSTVLLLQSADAVVGGGDGSDPRHRRRAAEVARLLERLSRESRVPYVLAARR